MLAKFQNDLKSITMSSIKCLNFKFLYLKLCKNDGLLDFILDKIILGQNLVCVLKYIYIYIYIIYQWDSQIIIPIEIF